MNEKARKYVDMFRQVKIATAATVDAGGHPQARIINVMLVEDDGMYIVTSKGKPFYKQLVETGESRYILDAFHIYEGHGEWFDLLHYPINRETFSYGGAEEERNGFVIADSCIGCGACAKACPQQCISAGQPYVIAPEHCLQCGRCAEFCPVQAVRRLHP